MKKRTHISLAQQAGIAVRTLIYWEMGERQPRREEIVNVLDALGVTEAEKTHAYSLLTTPRGIQMVRDSQETNTEMTGFVADFGDLLMSLRLRRGWTREQVADTLGVSLSSLTRWEHSRVFPTEETLIRLCDLLRAAAEERNALLGRRHHSSVWTAIPSLDEATMLLAAGKQTLEKANAPLADLHALLMKRSFRLMAIHEPKAEHLLAQAEASHILWLLYQNRLEEARQTAEYALQCSKTTYGKEA